MIYLLTLTLAFCSVVYELLLGQTLSAFLGNTVLRYSVTIGLYMLSMGIGAFIVNAKALKRAVISLQIVEILLALIGGYSLALLFFLDWLGVPTLLFSIIAHSLIIIIGILTGTEIPLLMKMRAREKEDKESTVLGVDYIGAFLGTLVFAFFFYPVAGLTASALSVAFLNSLVGLLLITQKKHIAENKTKPLFTRLIIGQALVSLLLAYSLWNSKGLNEFYINLYLST